MEIIGITLQISVSNGSVVGFPAMYQMSSARNIPGSTIEAPMIAVRNVRMYFPHPRLSSMYVQDKRFVMSAPDSEFRMSSVSSQPFLAAITP